MLWQAGVAAPHVVHRLTPYCISHQKLAKDLYRLYLTPNTDKDTLLAVLRRAEHSLL